MNAPTPADPVESQEDAQRIAAGITWRPSLDDLVYFEQHVWDGQDPLEDEDALADALNILVREGAKPAIADTLGRALTLRERDLIADELFVVWAGDGELEAARRIHPGFLRETS